MVTSPPVTVRAVACALTLTPSSRLSRASFRACLAQRRRRRWPRRCSGKQAVVEEEAASSREAKNGEGDEGRGAKGWFSLDTIGLDILSIALPAALALAADPIAALVDTAFVGHLGSAELAAVGVSISVFNLVSKLFNVPLLNVTTSFVAEQQATDDGYTGTREGYDFPRSPEELTPKRKFLPAVSTSLALAAGIGLMETVALIFGSGTLMDMIGVPIDSPMRIPAEQFLTFRAYGAPPIVIALAAQGAFRGLMDTKTPLYAVGVGNLVNVILDAILVFPLGLGVRGAALATVTSEYVIACILLWKLNSKVVIFSRNVIGGGIIRYLKSGGLLIGRTIAVLLTMTLSTSLAAREGPVPMAGHQLCLQVWLTISLLNDALALAGQALLASEYAKGNYKQARLVLYRVLQIGGVTGIALAVSLFFGFGSFSVLFTNDPAVLDIAKSGVWFVTVSQPINAIAFVIDGLYYGVSDFAYAAYSMFFVGAVSSAFLLAAAPKLGLGGVWSGLVREQRWTMEAHLPTFAVNVEETNWSEARGCTLLILYLQWRIRKGPTWLERPKPIDLPGPTVQRAQKAGPHRIQSNQSHSDHCDHLADAATPARPAAAAHARDPSTGPNRISLTSCRCHRRRSTPPRWRSLPRCSRGGGKPVITDVVDEVTPDEGTETEIKGGEETEAVAGRGAPWWLRLDGVAADILAIAAPAVLALATDPITALVDTAFVGNIGSAQLAAVGASTSIFNLVSKLFNVPLLNVTTSFVAEQQAVDANSNTEGERFTNVSTSRTVSYTEGTWCSTNHSGTCSSGCISWIPGHEDTIVCCGYLTAFILLWKLNNEVDLFSWNIIEDGGVIRYLKSGWSISLMLIQGFFRLMVGGVTGFALAAFLFVGFGSLSLLFTDDPAVLDVARSGVWFVTISQPVNAIAFVADGLYYGVSDFAYAAYSTVREQMWTLGGYLAVKKCPFFRWLEEYKKVVAKKLKEDLLAAVPLEGHCETKCQEEMKLKSRIFYEDRIYLKMDKLIDLVQLLVVLCLVMAVIVLLGVVVLISK
ncbi:unnamed protein product [Miscanthus lutarioriparius]|uniref:Protein DETOXIFICATION n=1 Tax=Miscanthus lutarioriparius TaxID=422564 RepID=A0A811QMB7_9POAL|nr:unnamed protein product [Miscanthus lutarioriparius]